MYRDFLAGLADLCIRRRRAVLAAAVVLTLIFGALAATLDLNLSFLALLPDNEPDVELFREATQKFGGSSDLLLLIQSQNRDSAVRFAEALAERLREFDRKMARETGRPFLRSIDYKVDRDFLEEHALLLAEEEKLAGAFAFLQENREELSGLCRDLRLAPFLERLRSSVDRMSREEPNRPEAGKVANSLRMANGGMEILDEYIRKGPETDEGWVRDRLVETQGADMRSYMRGYLEGGYFFSPDGDVLLMSLRMDMDIVSMPLGILVFGDIERIVREVGADFPDVRTDCTGMMAMAYEDQTSVTKKFQYLSTLSLVLVAAMFFYISRLPSGPFLVGAALLMAMVWTFGIVKLGLGYASLSSMVFAVLLFGLGIDFAIHIMSRLNEERRHEADPERALRRAIETSGRGILTGGCTTALAFFAMCISSDKSAVHLGFTTGWGLICCLAAMMLVFPALLCGRFQGKYPAKSFGPGTNRNRALEWWVAKVSARPVLALAVSCLLLVGFGIQIRHFRMEYDLEKIFTRDMPSVRAKALLEEKFGQGSEFSMVISRDLRQDADFTRRLRGAKDSSGRAIFSQVLSISAFAPPAESQKARRSELRRIHEVLESVRIEARAETPSPLSEEELKAVLEQVRGIRDTLRSMPGSLQGFLLGPLCERFDRAIAFCEGNPERARANLGYLQFLAGRKSEELLADIRRMTSPAAGGSDEILTPQSLPAGLRERFSSRQGDSFLILAYPKNGSLALENIRTLRKALEEIAPGQATGIHFVTERMVASGLKDFPKIMLAVSLVLFLFLWMDFRSLKYLVFSGLPLIFSGVIGLGVICASGATISVLMLMAFPLIFGIGIDDGVHILHRYREDRDMAGTIACTGRAVLLTTVTTLASFGVLLFTNHSGLIGMGLMVGVGVALCFVFSVTLLPALLAVFPDRK